MEGLVAGLDPVVGGARRGAFQPHVDGKIEHQGEFGAIVAHHVPLERSDQGFGRAAAEPQRCFLIDASPAADEVTQAIWCAVQARLGVSA